MGEYKHFRMPEYTWRVWINEILCVYCTKAPNRFHRFMQWLILGFRWEHIDG